MADQDWESVTRIGSKARGPGSGGVDRERVVKGKSAINAAHRAGTITGTQKKYAGGANTKSDPNGQLKSKIADDPDVIPPKQVGAAVGRAIVNGRTTRPDGSPAMTQITLAAKVNTTVAIISQFESGKAAPDNALLAKMERVLNVKLRGPTAELGTVLRATKK